MSTDGLRWQRHAACRGAGLTLFFAGDDETPGARDSREASAKAMCARCPVWLHCLRYRLGTSQQLDGAVWGGKNEYERRQLRRNMLRAERRKAVA